MIISDKLRVLLTNDVSETQASFELFDLGLSTAVLEELLAHSDNKWLTEWSSDLASKQMEELSGRGTLGECEVHILCDHSLSHVISRVSVSTITQGQEPLDAAR